MTKNYDFKIYEGDSLVAEAESLILSVSETHKKYKLENINIFPNFHLLNDETNLYSINFLADNASGIECEYSITSCIFTNRSSVSADYKHIDFIEGDFGKFEGTLTFDEFSTTREINV